MGESFSFVLIVDIGGKKRMVRLEKKGIRALGIAESFTRGPPLSVLAGVVMRSDGIVDGFACATATVGGMDATESVLKIFQSLNRKDLNVILLNGCVISWFNVIDVERIFHETSVPVICVTYEPSEGLEKYISEYFDDPERLEAYKKLGAREKVEIFDHTLYIRFSGLKKSDAVGILKKFSSSGAVPEPLRVARIIARGVMKMVHGLGNQNLYKDDLIHE